MTRRVMGQLNALATIEAENTFTAALPLQSGEQASVSLSGLTDSTGTLQRKLNGSDWRDVWEFAPADIGTEFPEKTYFADERCFIRLGVKTGDYGTDTITARIGKGG